MRAVPPKLVDDRRRPAVRPDPLLVIIAAAVAIVFGVILRQTRFGRYTYAIGSNVEAARRAGINVDRHLIEVYALSGRSPAWPGS